MIGGFSVLDVFVCPLGDLGLLELPPDAGDIVLLCEDDHGLRSTVATTWRVADGVKSGVLPAADAYVVPEWPSYWPHYLHLGRDAVMKLDPAPGVEAHDADVQPAVPEVSACHDGAVEAYWMSSKPSA
jgi:hypothetical protein